LTQSGHHADIHACPSDYGFNNDRHVNSISHLFWARALLAYTLPDSKQNFMVSLTAGTSIETDRFSAYRLGGFLPLASEFPLTLPGYFYQELSATRFALFNANYSVPLDPAKRFALTAVASTAYLNYLPGFEQRGNWNSGVGGGLSYHSTSDAWQILLDYGYGIDAIRTRGRGAQTVGILVQLNLERTQSKYYNTNDNNNGILRGLRLKAEGKSNGDGQLVASIRRTGLADGAKRLNRAWILLRRWRIQRRLLQSPISSAYTRQSNCQDQEQEQRLGARDSPRDDQPL